MPLYHDMKLSNKNSKDFTRISTFNYIVKTLVIMWECRFILRTIRLVPAWCIIIAMDYSDKDWW